VRAFAERVQNERRLAALYLLTVADIRGTSPKVWNAWKGKLLEDLFHLTRRLFAGQGTSLESSVQARQEEAQSKLAALCTTLRMHTTNCGLNSTLRISCGTTHRKSPWHTAFALLPYRHRRAGGESPPFSRR
jgi:[protein-PII] uridylyltransferase